MNQTEYNLLIDKIKKILQGVSLSETDIEPTSEEMERVQQALVYLSNCLQEINEFSGTLSRGELDAPQPSRHNYLAGELKELHAVLRHLTWQTEQVASGDYKQKINFLGDFSKSFNLMVKQLDEREKQLKESSKALEQSMKLITTIMDMHKDWIIVANKEDRKVLYNNMHEERPMTIYSPSRMGMIEVPLEKRDGSIAPLDAVLYFHEQRASYYSIHDYHTIWNNSEVIIHYITNVTQEQKVKKNLSDMAYTDQLTGVYNRRYCMEETAALLENKAKFSFVLIDLNELKYVNDNKGHEEGDAYIKYAVKIMNDLTRDSDVICRIGGDEFILLLKNCDGNIAHKKMEQIFNEINVNSDKGYRRSISYGITYVDENKNYTVKELMDESDKKMYDFKQEFKKSRGI